MKKLIFTVLFVFSSFVFACADTAKEETSDETEETSSEASDEPSSEPASEPTSEPSTSEPDCADLPQQECYSCVADENPAGAQAYNNYLFEHCVCANECETDCADTCADPNNVTQECNSCIDTVGQDQNSACVQDFGAACQADSSCIAFAQAIQACF